MSRVCSIDLPLARAMVAAYRELEPPDPIEAVAVCGPDEAPGWGARLLGFDLSCGYGNSLISGWRDPAQEGDPAYPDDAVRAMLEEMRGILGRSLNEHSLFVDVASASRYLDLAMRIQGRIPGFFEYGDYGVVAIWAAATEGAGSTPLRP